MKWSEYLEKFNDGEIDYQDVESSFGSMENFFKFMSSKGLLPRIDFSKTNLNFEDWENEYLLTLYESDTEYFKERIAKELSDIEYIDGEFYWESYRGDLAMLFCDSNRNSSRDIVNHLFKDEGFHEYFDNTTDDVYRDVIEELTKENLTILSNLIIFELKDVKVETETELLENIAQEQNHPDYVVVDESNIFTILDDGETTKFLLNEYLDEIKSNLYWVHNNAINSAMEDEYWEDMWSELATYFEGRGEWITKPNNKKELFRIKTKNFITYILDYLNENKKYGFSGNLSYYGNYIDLLVNTQDCLRMSEIDWPSYRKVDENINLYFNDYL